MNPASSQLVVMHRQGAYGIALPLLTHRSAAGVHKLAHRAAGLERLAQLLRGLHAGDCSLPFASRA